MAGYKHIRDQSEALRRQALRKKAEQEARETSETHRAVALASPHVVAELTKVGKGLLGTRLGLFKNFGVWQRADPPHTFIKRHMWGLQTTEGMPVVLVRLDFREPIGFHLNIERTDFSAAGLHKDLHASVAEALVASINHINSAILRNSYECSVETTFL